MKLVSYTEAVGPFTSLDLEPGTYEGKLYPIVTASYVKQRRARWLSVALFGKGLQLIYVVSCKCRMCRFNRLRSLFFMRPLNQIEWKEWEEKWTGKNS